MKIWNVLGRVLASKFRHEAVNGVNENKRGPNMGVVVYKVEE
jgi:hypothetical protein